IESASWPQLVKVTSWVTRPDVVDDLHSGNGGIDLIGSFVYEGERYVLVVQCKHSKTFPQAVRELKGVMATYLSKQMSTEAKLASSNIIISDENSIYDDDLICFIEDLQHKKVLRHLKERKALREKLKGEVKEEIENEVKTNGTLHKLQ
ncbi:10111_t:CDS:2, partial [Entrophospora sp. SA101]